MVVMGFSRYTRRGGRARKVLELTVREALRVRHHYVGTEHIRLALLEFEDGIGPLNRLGLAKPTIEAEIVGVVALIAARSRA